MISKGGGESKLPVNYVFVDYQNVHALDVSLIGKKTVYLTVMLGPDCRVGEETLERLLAHSASVELVRLARHGDNALDFALAFYLGKAVAADPTAYFHIVSKDADYGPMIDHLNARHIRVQRHMDYSTLTFTVLTTIEERLPRALELLEKRPANRPTSKETLENWLRSMCGRAASSAQINELIDRLCKTGRVLIDENHAVRYSFEPVL